MKKILFPGIFCACFLAVTLCGSDWTLRKDGWDILLKTNGFRIVKDGVSLSNGTQCNVVAGPQWKPILDSAAFAAAVRAGKVEQNGSRLALTMEQDKTRGVMALEVIDAERLRISWAIETDAPVLADTTVWFLGLDQEDFALGEARFGKNQSVTLPRRAADEELRKSKWRLTPDVHEMAISGKRGELTISGSYFHLFDARFHAYFQPELRTFCLRSAAVANHGKAEFIIGFRPMAALTVRVVENTDSASHYLDCGTSLAPLKIGTNLLKVDSPAGTEKLALTVVDRDGRERTSFGTADNVNMQLHDTDAFVRVAAFRGETKIAAGGPFAILSDDAPVMLGEAGKRLAALDGKFPASALDGVKREYARFSAQRAMPANASELASRRASVDALLRRLSWFEAARPGETRIGVVLLPSSARVMPGAEFSAPGRELSLHGAGGETLFFQVAVLPLGGETGRVTLEAPRLKKGSPEHVRIFEVLPVRVGRTWYPDMLEERNTVRMAGQPVNFLVAVKLPSGCPAGRQTLEIELRPENASAVTLRIPLEVYPFDLPAIPGILTAGSFLETEFKNYLPQAEPSEWERFLNFVSEHKITLHGSMKHPRELDCFDWKLNAVQLNAWKAGGALNLGCLPWIEWLEKYYYAVQPEAKFKSAAAYYAMAADRIAVNAEVVAPVDSQRVYFYYDEIGTGQKEVADFLRDLKKRTGAGLMTCFDKPEFGEDYVNYYRDLPEWMIFCSRYFEDGRFRGFFDSLRAEGKKIGWYFNDSYPKMPSFNAIETPPERQKALVLFMLREKISCNLLWGLNCWQPSMAAGAPFPYELKGGGNGFLFYPAGDRKHIASSLRFEMLLESIELAQYFELLNRVATENPNSPAAAEARKLLEFRELGELWACTATAETLDGMKRRAAELIGASGRGL